MFKPKLLITLFFISFWISTSAQGEQNKKLKIFLDCSGSICDQNFIRTEISLVDFLNDRLAADVHLLITTSPTGLGTTLYQLIFYDLIKKNHTDTLRFYSEVNATGAEKRERLLQYIKLGLAPWIAHTSYATAVNIQMHPNKDSSNILNTQDNWNYFVFNASAEGSVSADQNYTDISSSVGFTVSRVTNASRFKFSISGSRYVSTYKITEDDESIKYKVENSSYHIRHYFVKAISQHWGIGYSAGLMNSTFANTRSRIFLNPVVEYNFFKFSDINNRLFTLRYGAELVHFSYYDTTLYNRKQESLPGHEVSMSLRFTQKWGSLSCGAYYRNYFKDASFYSAGAEIYFDVRITGGLSLYIAGTGNIIHDQVYLKKGMATEQEILIRRRQLASSFDYETSFGINLRFGSKINNFINQRISGYRGF